MEDVCELFSTYITYITACASKIGLKDTRAFDIKMGCDMRKPEAKRQALEFIKQRKPELACVSPPCRMYWVFQRLRKHRDAQYTQDMKDAHDMLSFAMEVCEVQRQAGRKFFFEHPWEADSWNEESVKDLLKRVDVECVRLDQCCMGLRGVKTHLRHKKPIGIMTNCREIAERLNKRCSRMHEHEPIAKM